MYHAFFAFGPNVFLLFDFSCINISEPGGATGVESKWYSYSIASHADSIGFCLNFLTMLILKSTCGINLHQYAIGNVRGKDATIDFMQDLYVWIDRSAGFVQCIYVGLYCWSVCWIAMKSSTYFDVSLSIFCSCGLKPLISQYV